MNKKGFSLLELILVLGVGSLMTFLKFQDMRHEQDNLLASSTGQQMKQLGEAVNGYINIRYDRISTLSNAAGTGTDPGPRTCTGSVCEINYKTLVNEGLLPTAYTGLNAFKSSYKIILKRDGTAPNYVINGLITTSAAWVEGGNTRYDLLGKAMQTAGIDSGMTKTTSSANGYGGQWSENSASFNNITTAGQLAFRVGFNSALYSIYLRRDGTLPMTGNLNMGANDINNAKNITASGIGSFGGNINSGGNINAAREIIAHNRYGDTIALGGDAAGNDYELRLSNGTKPLSIYSPNAADYTTVLQVWKNTKIQQRLSTNGLEPNDLPSGWSGGLRTNDVYAAGTVGAGSGGAVNAYINSAGNIYASNDINAGHQVNAQYVWASGNLNSNYVHSNGNIDAAGQVYGANGVVSGGRTTVGEFLQLNGHAGIGGGCSPNGLIGRTSSGSLLSCVSGTWKAAGQGNIYYNSATATAYRFPSATVYCNGNDIALGGGGQCSSKSGFIWLNGNRPVGDNGWFASCDQNKTDDGNSSIITYVKCSAQ